MKKVLIIFIITLLAANSFAQEKTDTVCVEEKKIIKFLFSFDSRNTFAFGTRTKMFGFRIGIEILEKHRIGNGVYQMNNPVVLENTNSLNQQTHVDFGYTSIFYEYILFKNKMWEVAPTFYTGGGSAKTSNFDSNGNIIYDEEGNSLSESTSLTVSMIGIGVNTQFKPIRFAAIGVGIGYRSIVTNNKELRRSLNSPLYVIKVKNFSVRIS